MIRPSPSRRLRRTALLLSSGLLVLATAASAAPKKPRTSDLIWQRPDFASLGIESIAMLPVATYDNNLEAERLTGQALGMALKGSGHRWLSPVTARALLSGDAAAEDPSKRARETILKMASEDSDHRWLPPDTARVLLSGHAAPEDLYRRAREAILKDVRVDSLLAPALCAKLRTDAVLSVRVDQWEQRRLDRNEPGKPSTSVIVRAAMVDSLGRLVWSGSGNETLEGPEQQVDTRQPDLAGGSFGRGPAGYQSQAPAYVDVLNKLFARWGPQFPPRAAAAPAAEPAKQP